MVSEGSGRVVIGRVVSGRSLQNQNDYFVKKLQKMKKRK
tara:strand:- start:167 stop:283 length:117 start_codon:yes stop_codon:yes gene_type:complete